MNKIKIVGVTTAYAEAWEDGSRLVGHVDVLTGGILMQGCIVIERPNGSHICIPPRVPGNRGQNRALKFVSRDLKDAITSAAVAALERLDG
ncbi:hypothetical protein [Rhodobacteraceae bacterium DSL-40]|uniref:hypothetical protein n=1 Tax=Amaricoccus sp. B4 TaxID=3368557 RepID=UPI000DABD139